jgi:hypothetical protein
MQRSKAHHFLPQSYLRSFASARKKSRRHYIWQFDKSSGRIAEVDIATVAVRNLFHEIEAIDARVFNYESNMTHIENMFLGSWRALSDNFTPETMERERPRLAVYLAFLLLRSAKVRDDIRRLMDQLAQEHVPAVAPDLQLSLGKQDAHKTHYEIMREELDHVATQFGKMKWVLCRNATNVLFVTSDYPFAFTDPPDGLRWTAEQAPHAVGLDSFLLDVPGIRLYLPITPRKLLLLCDPRADWQLPEEILPKPESVSDINKLQVRRCIRSVFASTDQFAFAERLIRDFPSLRNVDARRWELNLTWEPVEPTGKAGGDAS